MFDFDDVTVAEIPVLSACLNGIVTFVTAFLTSVVLYAMLGTNFLGDLVSGSVPSVAQLVFVFYGGHFVEFRFGGETANFALQFAQGGGLYVVLVALLLVGTGYNVAKRDAVPENVRSKTLAGAAIALGYAPLAAAVGVTYSVSTAGTTLSLVAWQAVLYAGILLPVGLGGLGGYAAAHRD